MNTDKDVRQVDASEVNKQTRVLSAEEGRQKLKEISEAVPEVRDALGGEPDDNR